VPYLSATTRRYTNSRLPLPLPTEALCTVDCMSDGICVIVATAAAWIGVIVYFVSYLPFTYVGNDTQYAELTAKEKFGMSLVPNLAMCVGCKILAQYESAGNITFISAPVVYSQKFTNCRYGLVIHTGQ